MQQKLRFALIVPALALAAACARETATPSEFEYAVPGASGIADARIASDLAAVRNLTAPFHDLESAQAAGWSVLVPRCRDNPPTGGMGWHYANPAFIDGVVSPLEPEVLVYEPQKNGQQKLVGVEYLIPWSILPSTAEPPTLFGQQFLPNSGDEVWMLHVWIWANNPDGMFATWNPNVSCQHAG